MHSTFYYVLIFNIFTTELCSGQQKSDNDGFRELNPAPQDRNFRNVYSPSGALGNIPDTYSSSTTEMPQLTGSDISQLSDDKLGLEAIKQLHRQLDDDANGNVDLSESDEFLREELKYEDGHERRQKAFHRNDDMHISVRELWEAWVRSEVHNWTVEQTTEWLSSSVELPQYVPNFLMHKVTGNKLPRLAVNNMQYLVNVLGIKDPIHKQKIALKAMDVVLFGPPKDGGHIKDLVLMTLLMGALGGCWYAYRQKMLSQEDLQRMIKDMESLHMAEQKLILTQKELEAARHEQETVSSQKEMLERKLQERTSSPGSVTKISDNEVIQLKAEIESLRLELRRAEGELVDRCWAPPSGLQQWLQLTHEVENKAYMKKKSSAEKQLQQARDACEKLKKKRSSLVGAFVSTHGKSIDDVDRSIVEARTSLNEVTHELQERVHRWKQIEMLCGFNIINNSGLHYLENMLYRQSNGRLGSSIRSSGRMNSQDDLDDDSVSQQFSPGANSEGVEGLPWRDGTADSSGSETGRDDGIDSLCSSLMQQTPSPVSFSLGDLSPLDEEQPALLPETSAFRTSMSPVSDIKRNVTMPRSVSQEAHVHLAADREVTPPKVSHSESNLEAAALTSRPKKLTDSYGTSSLEEETYSTDSSSAATPTEEEMKRKRRKLHFPTFTRKSKSTGKSPTS